MSHERLINSKTAEIDALMGRWLGRGGSDSLRDGLRRGGIELDDAQRGTFKTMHFTARAVLEADDLVQLRSTVDGSPEPHAALQQCAGLPGNVRFARCGGEQRLAAETRIDGAVHLPDSLGEIKRGFFSLLGKSVAGDDGAVDDAPPAEALRTAIAEAGWTAEQAVETDYGWELHPRVAGTAVPVQAVLTADGVILRRVIVAEPAEDAVDSVAHQALLFNERLRFCRLAVTEGRLVVESTLRTSLIRSDWLTYATQAVAFAARSVEPELKLLNDEPSVAQAYAEMFLNE